MTAISSVDNGVNTQALLDARDALSDAPAGAQFTWRATCTWLHGTYSRSTVKGFHGLGTDVMTAMRSLPTKGTGTAGLSCWRRVPVT